MKTVWLHGIAALAMLGSVPVRGAAPAPASVLNLDMRDQKCTIEAAGKDEARDQATNELRLIDHQRAVNDKFGVLMDSRPWKHGVSMGEQMTPNEANEFGNLQEQLKIGMLSMMFESKRGRDMRVFVQAADIAKRMKGEYRLPKDEKSEEYFLALLLSVGRDKFELSDEAEADLIITRGSCSLQNALIAEAERTLNGLAKIPGVNTVEADLKPLVAKYGKPLDRAKLDENERVVFDRSQAVVRAGVERSNYYKDLLFISRLEAVSKLQRDVRRRSQYEAPGNPDHINVVWEAWKKESKISPDQNQLSQLMNYINEKVPTELVKDMDRMNAKKAAK